MFIYLSFIFLQALIAKRNGYPFQKYKVQTKDGYILSLFRIPNNNTDKTGPRQPLILQHGIAINSAAWLLQGKKSLGTFSLAFALT